MEERSMEEDDYDEELDVRSSKFNPLKALYSEKTIIPVPSAPLLDNLARYEAVMAQSQKSVKIDQLLVRPEKKESEASTSKLVSRENRFLPHQEPIQTTREIVPQRNILTKMANTYGPLAPLKDCVDKRIRIKVWTRNANGIRGYCQGFVAAFDKHWNLAMEDVKEVWSRKIKRKKILIGEGKDPPVIWKEIGPMVTPPKVIILKKEKGFETCERHVNQMLMRGEHVAFISILDT